MVLDDLKAMKLEEMAETAREIVEEGKDDENFNNNSNELGATSSAQQLKKLRKKAIIPVNKKHQIAKIKGFKKEIEKLFI